MIEKIVLDYLSANLDVPVYLERPEKPPKKFVLIEKTSSGLKNGIKSATFAVQSYDTSLFKACELNEVVKEAMLMIISEDSISKCSLNSDYNFTNGTTKNIDIKLFLISNIIKK